MEDKNGWVYYRNEDDGNKLYKKSADGKENIKLCDVGCLSVVVSGGFVYFIRYEEHKTNCICRIKTDGSGFQYLNDSDSANLNVRGAWVYYDLVVYDDIDGENEYYPYKMRIDGSNNIAVTETEESESSLADRMADQAKGIVSQSTEEMDEYYTKLLKSMGVEPE